MAEFKKPPPLEIKCTSVDCVNDLHCFKATKKMTPDARGKCRACGADLVDWERLHRRDTADAEHTFEALRHETIRHHHFEKAIDDRAIDHARRKGRVRLSEAVRKRLLRYLAPAQPPRDGYQTPFVGNSIYYAQHATACCCRTCLEYWHGIPKGRELTPEEFDYCSALIDRYLAERLPELKDEPERVRRRPREKEPDAEEAVQS